LGRPLDRGTGAPTGERQEKISEELALKKARFALEQAQSKRKVLIDYTKNKTIKALLGAVETARGHELARQAVLERKRSAVKRLAEQIRRCKVAAPIDGLVRYTAPIGPGAVVHDGQVLFRIDTGGEPAVPAK